jgi:hypothetical protein
MFCIDGGDTFRGVGDFDGGFHEKHNTQRSVAVARF